MTSTLRLQTLITNMNKWSKDGELSLVESGKITMEELQEITLRLIGEEIQETVDALKLFEAQRETASPAVLVEILAELADGFADVFFLAVNGVYKVNPKEFDEFRADFIEEILFRTAPGTTLEVTRYADCVNALEHWKLWKPKLPEQTELMSVSVRAAGYAYWGLVDLMNQYASDGDAETVLSQVLVANDSKRQPDGSFAYNDKNKIMKPEGFVAPDHRALFEPYKG